ncbi:glycosyl transferase [Carbonactinospora thermoautotrophica]|uniref:Glycosyl transferase n=1 Tax=Carbonactinospora thermoautotrophica TaxID=1469144 RepID=A0A132MJH3_9ACTN|nr:glycosyltransferase family 9 protein [Carbonactinospora thermoautotrophica]KWW97978.1 glycosyl transferase [Carbonactinospora thermoautotrophica]KWX03110.1 Glycosyl transferase family 9 [Carbonactinospora thermoautotrophica]
MTGRVLAVRLDNAGDVLLTGPAIRALAARAGRVTVLAGPSGAEAARLLPGVGEVLTWRAPWADFDPPPVDPAAVTRLVTELRSRDLDEAVIFTSFHQSPLPAALLLRLAGVRRISAISEDYPGSLLDVRHRVPEHADLPEAERALSLARAAGYDLPAGDDGRLAVRRPLPDTRRLTGEEPYLVCHPGVSVPARAWLPERWRAAVAELVAAGHRVVVTGSPREIELTGAVAEAAPGVVDLGGRTSLAELAGVLDRAACAVVANTGPAHLAAAVGTPVVSLFAPVVPAPRWAPYGVPTVLLGDQEAPCRNSRARVCPVPGHPCLTSVTALDVRAAVEKLTGESLNA